MLTEETFLTFAMHHYDNVQCHTIQEFENDLSRFKYLNKLFGRYRKDQVLKDRLILNHIIILCNVFNDMATDLLFFKISKDYWPYLVTFLIYLRKMPEITPVLKIRASDIPIDSSIVTVLRTL